MSHIALHPICRTPLGLVVFLTASTVVDLLQRHSVLGNGVFHLALGVRPDVDLLIRCVVVDHIDLEDEASIFVVPSFQANLQHLCRRGTKPPLSLC